MTHTKLTGGRAKLFQGEKGTEGIFIVQWFWPWRRWERETVERLAWAMALYPRGTSAAGAAPQWTWVGTSPRMDEAERSIRAGRP